MESRIYILEGGEVEAIVEGHRFIPCKITFCLVECVCLCSVLLCVHSHHITDSLLYIYTVFASICLLYTGLLAIKQRTAKSHRYNFLITVMN